MYPRYLVPKLPLSLALKQYDDQYDIEDTVNEYHGGGIASGTNDSTLESLVL